MNLLGECHSPIVYWQKPYMKQKKNTEEFASSHTKPINKCDHTIPVKFCIQWVPTYVSKFTIKMYPL